MFYCFFYLTVYDYTVFVLPRWHNKRIIKPDVFLYEQGVALTERNTTGSPSRAAPW